MTVARADLAVWPAAVSAALLGTDRTPLSVPASDGPLGAVCTTLAQDEADPAAALLHVAAAARAYRRCGWMPAHTEEPPPAACPPDAHPVCGPAATGLLRRLLQGEHEHLLATWLGLAARHGVRAPADTLRNLLDLGRRDPAVRPLVVEAGGTRATWLAGFNEDWSYAIAGTSPDALVAIWETGSGAARLAALQRLRVLDADRARTELEKSWSEESPADRAAFVAALEHGLSPADESFLERSLDDRRKEVRQSAAALLARLPTSALVARMVGRATELMALGRSGLLKRPRLDVTPPAACDEALIRDGVNPKPPVGTGIGERAWWLAQIIAAVPPSYWTSAWSVEPDAVLRATDGHEWREPLLAGWLTATERHRDTQWAVAVWENASLVRVEPQWGAPAPERVFTDVVPPEQVDAELRRAVEGGRDVLRENHAVLVAILTLPNEWSDALARAVARRLKEYADRVQLPVEPGLRALLERCSRAVPVSAIDAFIDGWPDQSDAWPTWVPSVDALASVLRFRNDLHLAFNEESRS